MIRLFIYVFTGLLCSVFLINCKSGDNVENENTKTIDQLSDLLSTKEEFIKALNLELSNINNALGEISESHDASIDTIIDPLTRIKHFDDLLNTSKEKIRQLEKQQINVASNSDKELLSSIIKNLKETILEKENYIDRLKYEIDTLKISNTNLQFNLENTRSDLNVAMAHNTEKQKELLRLEQEYNKEKRYFDTEKERMNKELEKTKQSIDIEKSNAYYEIAMSLKEEFDNTKSNKLRKGLINKSYENFRKACQLGHKSSSSYIKLFLTDEKYSKELTITRSNTAISNCGI